jgi:hypothetical protein
VKTCVTCLKTKPLNEFYKRKDSLNGFRNDCKNCRKARSLKNFFDKCENRKQQMREYYKKRIEKNPNWHIDFYTENKEKVLANNKIYYQKHRAKRLQSVLEWARSNKGRANANKKAYKTSKQQACPKWVRDNGDLMWMMQEAYDLAMLRSNMFGFQWHVDHVVPLRGKVVSGIHVPWNLQVIPGRENCSKSNRFEA